MWRRPSPYSEVEMETEKETLASPLDRALANMIARGLGGSANVVESVITALEADNAAKDAALRAFLDAKPLWLPEGEVAMEYAEEAKVLVGLAAQAKAALSPSPSGKVLVPLDKLREIEWVGGHVSTSPFNSDPIPGRCPTCDRRADSGHAPDCWLDALLKEGDDA